MTLEIQLQELNEQLVELAKADPKVREILAQHAEMLAEGEASL